MFEKVLFLHSNINRKIWLTIFDNENVIIRNFHEMRCILLSSILDLFHKLLFVVSEEYNYSAGVGWRDGEKRHTTVIE